MTEAVSVTEKIVMTTRVRLLKLVAAVEDGGEDDDIIILFGLYHSLGKGILKEDSRSGGIGLALTAPP